VGTDAALTAEIISYSARAGTLRRLDLFVRASPYEDATPPHTAKAQRADHTRQPHISAPIQARVLKALERKAPRRRRTHCSGSTNGRSDHAQRRPGERRTLSAQSWTFSRCWIGFSPTRHVTRRDQWDARLRCCHRHRDARPQTSAATRQQLDGWSPRSIDADGRIAEFGMAGLQKDCRK